MKFILGSSSPFRKLIMQEIGIDFAVIKPDINEKAIRDADPERLVLKIAHAKAEAIREKIDEPAIIITADQVVTFEGTIREKPISTDEARYFLSSYGQAPSRAINGIVVTNTENGRQLVSLDSTELYLNPLPKEIIDELIDERVVMNCAGALLSEDPLIMPYIKEIRGSQDSLMGLPKTVVKKLLKEIMR